MNRTFFELTLGDGFELEDEDRDKNRDESIRRSATVIYGGIALRYRDSVDNVAKVAKLMEEQKPEKPAQCPGDTSRPKRVF